MSVFHLILSGILIGTGVVLPGVSGSVIAIIMGVYDYIIYLLNDSELNSYSKIVKLLPIMLGLIFGIILFGNVLLIFYKYFKYEMMYIFIGLILGEVPLLMKKVKQKKSEKINGLLLFSSILISFLLVFLPNIFDISNSNSFNPLNLFIAGLLYISGKIIPGISSSLFLMILGLYEYILNILSNPLSLTLSEFIMLIPFFIGIIIGMVFLVKLINYLLNNHFSKTYSVIIGFVIGSVFALYPGFEIGVRGLISILLMAGSFGIVYKLSKKN